MPIYVIVFPPISAQRDFPLNRQIGAMVQILSSVSQRIACESMANLGTTIRRKFID